MLLRARRLALSCTFALGLSLGLTACPSAPPPPPPPVAEAPPAPAEVLKERRLTVRKGDTLQRLVQAASVPAALGRKLLSALGGVWDARRLRPGHQLVLWENAQGELARVSYEASPLEAVDLTREADGFRAEKRQVEVTREQHTVSVQVRSSLYEAFADAGEDPQLAAAASEVLAWEVDFYRDVQKGDRIDLVVERQRVDGQTVGYGPLLAVRYDGQVGRKALFRWEGPQSTGYYDLDGRSARRALLKQPLPFVHITSRFGGRLHPVLGYFKQHEGVDYGAPTGTGVWSVGDGVVTFAGYKGANGNLVSVRHSNGVTSHYAHLSQVLVKSGARVTQKQLVGKVGATGRATGPHLHFALSQGGRFLNPLRQDMPAGEPLPLSQRAAFLQAVSPLVHQLDAGRMVASAQ